MWFIGADRHVYHWFTPTQLLNVFSRVEQKQEGAGRRGLVYNHNLGVVDLLATRRTKAQSCSCMSPLIVYDVHHLHDRCFHMVCTVAPRAQNKAL